MRIVFFMQDTGAVYGAERATIDLACGLRAAGDNPHFFLMVEKRLSGKTSRLQQALMEHQFPVDLFPVSGRISYALASNIKMAFKRIGGDVLHVIGYKANLHAQWSGIRPVVATVHGWLFRQQIKERMYDAIDRWCLRRCDHVICLSNYYEKLLLKSGIAQDRLSRIPSGLRNLPDEEVLRSPLHQHDPMVFGMMGRFSEEKNHAMFLDAALLVYQHYPAVTFMLAGEGPLEQILRTKVDQLGLSLVVSFCGYMDVPTFMRAIDVYVLVSNIENLPYSILEAMAWSRPVIGTRVGGIPDLVDHDRTGLLVGSGDAAGLSEAMTRMIEHEDSIMPMGMNGREKVQTYFTLARSTAMHQACYRQLTGGGHD